MSGVYTGTYLDSYQAGGGMGFVYAHDILYADDIPYAAAVSAVSVSGSVAAQQVTGSIR
jgi:hypothetical protein